MRWYKKKEEPLIGSVERKVKFAFFPTLIDNQYVWLERYWVFYKYEVRSLAYQTQYGGGFREVLDWYEDQKALID